MTLPILNSEARANIASLGVYHDKQVAALVQSPALIYRLIYGDAGLGAVSDHRDALSHLEGDIADKKAELAELERARAALTILTQRKSR